MASDCVEIVEVSPRDGIQNGRAILSTEDEVALIGTAREAGLRRIEAVSFVDPARVPALAAAFGCPLEGEVPVARARPPGRVMRAGGSPHAT